MVVNADHPLIKQFIEKGEAAAEGDKVKQLIDLALLSNGLLKGEALTNFVKRSYGLID
jgi:molecular chaperone HtpG